MIPFGVVTVLDWSVEQVQQRQGSTFLRSIAFRFLSILILLPHPFSVGNASEEVYFGLLTARRTGKRLLVLAPLQLRGVLRLPLLDFSIVDVQSEFMVCRPLNPLLLPLRWIVTIYFGIWRLISEVRVSRLGLQGLSTERTWPNAGQDRIWLPESGSRAFSWDAVDELNWEEQFARPLNVRLSARTCQSGSDALIGMGVPEGSWFACVHVREGGFWGDHNSPRNADIHSYIPMLKEIVSAGGHVVRMGDRTMTPLPDLWNIHDYAVGPLKSAVTDAYLMKHCRFFIGMQSGLQDTALLYERPCLIVNMYDPNFALPFLVNHRGMFKIFHNLVTGNSIDPLDLVCRSDSIEERSLAGENASDDLTRALRNFLVALEQEFPRNEVHPREPEFQAQYRAFLEDPIAGASTNKHDVVQSYRFASRLTSGTLSRILTPLA
ncbi:MAG: TIGR04372 family glycosyltransferase [Actinobacteria bacterium]|nr:TIGR04372 family glycosyltransferase [Actinomycetota bacterium]